MGGIDVVGVFCGAVAGASEISDYITGLHNAALLQGFVIGIIFSQMGIVIITFFVKASDSQSPSSVLIPADRLDLPGFHTDNGSSHLPHKIMSQMAALKAIAAGCSEIIIIFIRKIPGNGTECLQSVSGLPDRL